jgi:3-methyl-2-oxobutanoate hydroxymethyltransferase
MKADGRQAAYLTAYDYPTAALAQAAGVHGLLIGDSMGTVLLGHPSTRTVPLALMLILGEAVRRGAPDVYLIGDMPYETLVHGPTVALDAAHRFHAECGCDAVKLEAQAGDEKLVAALAQARLAPIAHLGLRPQQVLTPDAYRAQARDAATIAQLVDEARCMVAAGAVMLLLEAVPTEAAQAVVDAVPVPIIGCGAGPACDGHIVVTQDMLGLSTIRPPRFVPLHAQLSQICADAMQRYVADIVNRAYPGPQHTYALRK